MLKSVRGDDQEEGQGKTRKGKVVVGGEERLGKGARGEVELKITVRQSNSMPDLYYLKDNFLLLVAFFLCVVADDFLTIFVFIPLSLPFFYVSYLV